eukprot:m.75849 g.75849  ORF g.75849 m.75849 type:complete len:510 (-) comp12524_c0_seq1:114-1643(-)
MQDDINILYRLTLGCFLSVISSPSVISTTTTSTSSSSSSTTSKTTTTTTVAYCVGGNGVQCTPKTGNVSACVTLTRVTDQCRHNIDCEACGYRECGDNGQSCTSRYVSYPEKKKKWMSNHPPECVVHAIHVDNNRTVCYTINHNLTGCSDNECVQCVIVQAGPGIGIALLLPFAFEWYFVPIVFILTYWCVALAGKGVVGDCDPCGVCCYWKCCGYDYDDCCCYYCYNSNNDIKWGLWRFNFWSWLKLADFVTDWLVYNMLLEEHTGLVGSGEEPHLKKCFTNLEWALHDPEEDGSGVKLASVYFKTFFAFCIIGTFTFMLEVVSWYKDANNDAFPQRSDWTERHEWWLEPLILIFEKIPQFTIQTLLLSKTYGSPAIDGPYRQMIQLLSVTVTGIIIVWNIKTYCDVHLRKRKKKCEVDVDVDNSPRENSIEIPLEKLSVEKDFAEIDESTEMTDTEIAEKTELAEKRIVKEPDERDSPTRETNESEKRIIKEPDESEKQTTETDEYI